MTVKFKEAVKQNTYLLPPGVALAFEDDHAEDYFKEMSWAEDSTEEPVFTYPKGSVDIHPETIHGTGGKKGQFVLPERAKAHQEAQRQAEAEAPAEEEAE